MFQDKRGVVWLPVVEPHWGPCVNDAYEEAQESAKKALEENLEEITKSVKFLAQQVLYQTEKDALIEAEENLTAIKKDIREEINDG